MTKKPQKHQKFAFFHQNEALLFQFFLNECLLTFQSLQEPHSEALISCLMGDHSHISHWESSPGHFPKLSHYYSLYITNFADPQAPHIKQLGEAIERSRRQVHLCAAIFEKDPIGAKQNFQNLKKEVKKITKILIEMIPDYQDNEHVIYFLLRSHEHFDSIYGDATIAKLFCKLFPGGIKEVGAFLEESYGRRGYTHLIPTISEKIALLESDLRNVK